MSEVGKQEIECTVTSCKNHDHTRYCSLHNIKVGTISGASADTKVETECDSFAK